jgi:hypothetical protein
MANMLDLLVERPHFVLAKDSHTGGKLQAGHLILTKAGLPLSP